MGDRVAGDFVISPYHYPSSESHTRGERSFSKLNKLIKNYLRSSMSQERLTKVSNNINRGGHIKAYRYMGNYEVIHKQKGETSRNDNSAYICRHFLLL